MKKYIIAIIAIIIGVSNKGNAKPDPVDCSGINYEPKILNDLEEPCRNDSIVEFKGTYNSQKNLTEVWKVGGSYSNAVKFDDNLSYFVKYTVTDENNCSQTDSVRVRQRGSFFYKEVFNIQVGLTSSENPISLTTESHGSTISKTFGDKNNNPINGINSNDGSFDTKILDVGEHEVFVFMEGCRDKTILNITPPKFKYNTKESYCNLDDPTEIFTNGNSTNAFIIIDQDTIALPNNIFDPSKYATGNHKLALNYNNHWSTLPINIYGPDQTQLVYKGNEFDTLDASLDFILDSLSTKNSQHIQSFYGNNITINNENLYSFTPVSVLNYGINEIITSSYDQCKLADTAFINITGAFIDTTDMVTCNKESGSYYLLDYCGPKGGTLELTGNGISEKIDTFLSPSSYPVGEYFLKYYFPGTEAADSIKFSIVEQTKLDLFFTDTLIITDKSQNRIPIKNALSGRFNYSNYFFYNDSITVPMFDTERTNTIIFTPFDCISKDTLVVIYKTDCENNSVGTQITFNGNRIDTTKLSLGYSVNLGTEIEKNNIIALNEEVNYSVNGSSITLPIVSTYNLNFGFNTIISTPINACLIPDTSYIEVNELIIYNQDLIACSNSNKLDTIYFEPKGGVVTIEGNGISEQTHLIDPTKYPVGNYSITYSFPGSSVSDTINYEIIEFDNSDFFETDSIIITSKNQKYISVNNFGGYLNNHEYILSGDSILIPDVNTSKTDLLIFTSKTCGASDTMKVIYRTVCEINSIESQLLLDGASYDSLIVSLGDLLSLSDSIQEHNSIGVENDFSYSLNGTFINSPQISYQDLKFGINTIISTPSNECIISDTIIIELNEVNIITTDLTICPNSRKIDTIYFEPTGGVIQIEGNGISEQTYLIDPSNYTPGTYKITYSFPGSSIADTIYYEVLSLENDKFFHSDTLLITDKNQKYISVNNTGGALNNSNYILSGDSISIPNSYSEKTDQLIFTSNKCEASDTLIVIYKTVCTPLSINSMLMVNGSYSDTVIMENYSAYSALSELSDHNAIGVNSNWSYLLNDTIKSDSSYNSFYIRSDKLGFGVNTLVNIPTHECVIPDTTYIFMNTVDIFNGDLSICPGSTKIDTIFYHPKGGVVKIEGDGIEEETEYIDPTKYAPGQYIITYSIPGTNVSDTINYTIQAPTLTTFFSTDTFNVTSGSNSFYVNTNDLAGYVYSQGSLSATKVNNQVYINPNMDNYGFKYVYFQNNCGIRDTLVLKFIDSPECNIKTESFSNIMTLRPGFTSFGILRFMNTGLSDITNATFKFDYDSEVKISNIIINSGNVTSHSNNTINFQANTFKPNEVIEIKMSIETNNNTSLIGELAEFNLEYSFNCGENDYTETYKIEELISGSYDPNHKEALIGDGPLKDEVSELTYKIQFQNTGNDTAFTVIVEDTINPKFFDISSVEMISTSHPYTLTTDAQNNLLIWEFENILLVDSMTNEPLSHGEIKFKITLKDDIKVYDMIKNKAFIYFDFNPAIITNEAYNYYENDNYSVELNSKNNWFVAQSDNNYIIKINNNVELGETFNILDLNGKLINSQYYRGSNIPINNTNLPSGIYIIQRVSNLETQRISIFK